MSLSYVVLGFIKTDDKRLIQFIIPVGVRHLRERKDDGRGEASPVVFARSGAIAKRRSDPVLYRRILLRKIRLF